MSENDHSATVELACEGWWQQEIFGRQPMEDLRLRFDGGRITGAGRDIVGAFTFIGTLGENGQVAMVKRYVGRHSVDYLGIYDGEGIMLGEWRIGPSHDRWFIKIKGPRAGTASNAEIQSLA